MAHIREKQVIDAKQIASDVVKYILLTIGALVLFFPFLWMLTTSLKTLSEAIATPPVWLPKASQWSNYVVVWSMKPFTRYLLNTVICCVCHVVGVVVFSVLGAYAFSMYSFRFKGFFFTLFMLTMSKFNSQVPKTAHFQGFFELSPPVQTGSGAGISNRIVTAHQAGITSTIPA